VPTWWIIGVAVYVPMFVGATADRVRSGEEDLGAAIAGSAFFLASGVLSGIFWFG
jgi:hypothetical protein